MRIPARLVRKDDKDHTLPPVSPLHEINVGTTGGIVALSLEKGAGALPTALPVDEEGNFVRYEPDNPAVLKKLFHLEEE